MDKTAVSPQKIAKILMLINVLVYQVKSLLE